MNKKLIESLQTNHPDVTLVMASKYLDKDAFGPYVDAGIKAFGESRVEALQDKIDTFRQYPVEVHLLGTLQTKKVKKIINDIDVLHSLDRVKLAKEINKRRERPLRCFIQVNISNEKQKHGVEPDDLMPFLESLKPLKNIQPIGLMGMAELTTDEVVIRRQFKLLRELRDTAKNTYPSLQYLSMGMTNDYEIALEEGTTHLRLGRILLNGGMHDEKEEKA